MMVTGNTTTRHDNSDRRHDNGNGQNSDWRHYSAGRGNG